MTRTSNESDWPAAVVATKVPEWMRGVKAEGLSEYIAAVEPRIQETIAEFGQIFQTNSNSDPEFDDKARLYKLIMAAYFRDVHSLHEWREQALYYPAKPLTDEQIETKQNPDVQMRAQFLKLGLTRLFELISAPPAFARDAETMLDWHAPKGAVIRAAVQAEWCENPRSTLRAIAKKLGCDHRQLYKDKARGLLIRPYVTNSRTAKVDKKRPKSK